MDISHIRLIACGNFTPFEERVNSIFLEEIKLRTGLALESNNTLDSEGSFILIRRIDMLKKHHSALLSCFDNMEQPGAEGFCLSVTRQGRDIRIIVGGADDRGCLYGMARVLRKLELRMGSIFDTDELLCMTLTPQYALRGHQLAYRDKQNTCPTWDTEDFERYIRDLALFGANAIEILPPRTDDKVYSPHFKRDPYEMMICLSRIIHSYGMDVWVWYPNDVRIFAHEADDEAKAMADSFELAERERIFSSLPFVDAVLIPAGDPGILEPKELFPITERNMKILHKYHPAARVWIAPQVFHPSPGWYEDFYSEINKEPLWLYGVCYAPWIRDTISEMRDNLSEKYKNRIRHYPDITHNSHSQFELASWDTALSLTQGREGYNTRARAMKHIHNSHAVYTIGSLTYSEGIHDDVNKIVWGDQDFDSNIGVEETLRDYCRLFISPDIALEMSELLLKTEQSWIGELATNKSVDEVYKGFLSLEEKCGDSVRNNFRFQMALLRAVSDYQIKLRAIYDAALEKKALKLLESASELGSLNAINNARQIFRKTSDEPVGIYEKQKIQMLADSLRENCGIRLTSRRHGAQSWIRGASLDSLDTPLNDSRWYMMNFMQIYSLADEAERLAELEKLLHRTDPGEGGKYLWLGNPNTFCESVISEKTWEDDPGYLRSPLLCHDPYGIQWLMHENEGWYNEFPITNRWVTRARTLYGTPLKVKIEGLDSSVKYKIKIAYPDLLALEADTVLHLRLTANGIPVHDKIDARKGTQNPVLEYALPDKAVKDGRLLLEWTMSGTLYPISVSEIWVLKSE